MAHRDPSSSTIPPTILRYGMGVLSVAVAIGLDFFLLRHFEAKLTPFLFAVAATVWYAGTGPGVLAIVLSVLSLNYFFLRPFVSFSPISHADLVYLTFCTLCALAVGWVSAVRRRAEQELRQAREDLDAKVVERTSNLQRNEGYLAEAQRLSHTGSWVFNVAARETIHWSQETYRLYGFDPEGGIPPFEALLQRIHPEDRGRYVDDLERAVCERADHEMIFRAVLPDGTLKYILGIGHPVLNASGDVVEFVCAAMDITERKRAEVVGQRLAAIVDSSEDAIVSKDLNGTIESWNGGAERLFGYKASEVIGKSILIIIPPDRHDEELGILDLIRRGERIKCYETVRMGQDGSLLDISLTVSPLRDAAGRIIGASKIARDITERKRAEEAIRESEEKWRAVFDNNPTMYCMVGATGILLSVNPFGADHLGYTVDELTGDSVLKVFQKDDRASAQQNMARCLDQLGKTMIWEARKVHKNGSILSVRETARAMLMKGGPVVLIACEDITQQKCAEEDLRRSEAFLAEAQKLTSTGSWAWDSRSQKVLYCSEEMFRIFGLDRGSLPTRNRLRERVHPDDRAMVDEGFARALREKVDSFDEYRIILPDGTLKYINSSGHPVLDDDGSTMAFVGTAVDVTERKHAEDALRESEAKFRDYAETASDWFWETGPDYKFTLLTENAFGSDAANRIGTSCWDHALDLETEPEKWRRVWATLEARKPFRDFVYCSVSGNQTPMYVKASGKPVFDANGEFRGYRGTGTDVTATVRAQEERERLRQLEADLAHMNRLSIMGELAASLAHEIMQPIATARNNARAAMRFLDRERPELGEVREALACIVDDGDRAGDIIDRIRDHIKKAPLRKERFDLNKAINEVIVLAQSAITKNGVSIRTRIAKRTFPVLGDRVQLQQVVLNLMLNAVEAMSSVAEGERELLISTAQSQAGGVLVAVRDSGPGIVPEHLERVFEAFYTTKSTGVGMGLSICRSIVKAHRGRLWADVNTPRGAVFQFTLPGEEKELMNSLPAARQTARAQETTVLNASRLVD